jgi:Ca-activated chloride channel family protein
MNREQAERLLAALFFDDLDEPSKAELLAYLQTDDELRDRLADMRLAIKLANDAVNDGPDPVLSEQRLAQLKWLAGTSKSRVRIFTMRRLMTVAAVLVFGVVMVGLIMPSLSKVHYYQRRSAAHLAAREQSRLRTLLDLEAGRDNTSSEPAASEIDRLILDSQREQAGAMMGGYGDAAAEVRNGAPAASDRLNFEMTGGESLPGQRVVASDESAGEQPKAPSPVRPMLRRERGPSIPPDQTLDLLAGFSRTDTATGSASAKEPVRLEAAPERVVAGVVQDHAWSDSVAPSKPATMPSPVWSGSPVVSNKPIDRSSGVIDSLDAGNRAPVLGDKPISGSLLKSKSDTKTDGGVDRFEVVGKSLEQLAESSEAGVPSASHFKEAPVNPWVMTDRDPLSTFALDVDTASYALCRRYIRSGYLPPIGAVRMEEFINAFDYAYPQRDDATFAVYAEGAPSPFAPAGQDVTLLKIAVKARTVGRDQRRAAHIVFVVDASASMGQADRLPLVQSALNLLVDKLSEADRVSLISCAGDARLHLEAVPAGQKDAIRRTIEAIQPAGSTNLMAGLRLAYAMARKAFVAGRINQVVLCSDGVANVGQTEAEAVLQEVAEDRKQGITLTCVGVGYGAYNDAFLETLADRGDGRYVFLDASQEAREALVGQLAATLQTVARDARIQVRFDPARVRRYRLIGYENRDIEDQRFRDDTVDAGEVGSGQCSTALYELELTARSSTGGDGDLGTVFVRYRHGETGQIEEISRPLVDSIIRRRAVEDDPRFFLAAGAARFAEWLRQSEYARDTSLGDIQRVLDQVCAALPLDRDVQDLAALAHQAENLPRAPQP